MVVVITATGGVTKRIFPFPVVVDSQLAEWANAFLNEQLTGVRLGGRMLVTRLDEPGLSPTERAFLDVLRPAFTELVAAAEQRYETLSGGQQARFQILLLELGGATLLLLDEPTDNLDLHSAEALERGLAAFEGTVLAVTHDRWFALGFDRFLLLGAYGEVVETPEPVWDAGRVERVR